VREKKDLYIFLISTALTMYCCQLKKWNPSVRD